MQKFLISSAVSFIAGASAIRMKAENSSDDSIRGFPSSDDSTQETTPVAEYEAVKYQSIQYKWTHAKYRMNVKYYSIDGYGWVDGQFDARYSDFERLDREIARLVPGVERISEFASKNCLHKFGSNERGHGLARYLNVLLKNMRSTRRLEIRGNDSFQNCQVSQFTDAWIRVCLNAEDTHAKTILNRYRSAADGDAGAMYQLGCMFGDSDSSTRKFPDAQHFGREYWYGKAASLGHVDAQYEFALLWYIGEGVDHCVNECLLYDYKKAREFFGLAAAQGHMQAQYNFARMCSRGRGGGKDLEQAREFWGKAAEQGHADSQYAFATMCLHGYGGDEDLQEAEKWYGAAAEQGNKNAYHKLIARFGAPDKLVERFGYPGNCALECRNGKTYVAGSF